MNSNIDIQAIRAETPGCHEVLHFNNAGAALMNQPVLDAVWGHLQLESQIGGYEAAARNQSAYAFTYEAIARMLGCRTSEIALMENATRAWDMAFSSLNLKSGDRILTGKNEYAANYIAFLQVCRRTGAEIVVIPEDQAGDLDLEALENLLDERVRLIALTHVATNGGPIYPAAEVGRLARKYGCVFLLDACQSVGQMPVSVAEIGCHMLAATGRKYLRGPRGTGFLYVEEGLIPQLEPPFLDMHAAEWTSPDSYTVSAGARRFETWESNLAGRIGLGVAVEYGNQLGWETIQERIKNLANRLRQSLRQIPGITVHDRGTNLCGIVSLMVEGRDPNQIKQQLAVQKVNVSVTERNATLLDMDSRGIDAMVRASVHYYNTEDEITRFCAALAASR